MTLKRIDLETSYLKKARDKGITTECYMKKWVGISGRSFVMSFLLRST